MALAGGETSDAGDQRAIPGRSRLPALCNYGQFGARGRSVAITALTQRPVTNYNNCIRGVAQLGSAGALGALGRRFESCRPD